MTPQVRWILVSLHHSRHDIISITHDAAVTLFQDVEEECNLCLHPDPNLFRGQPEKVHASQPPFLSRGSVLRLS